MDGEGDVSKDEGDVCAGEYVFLCVGVMSQ